ncbi:S-adenosyl-L-methionine-dependent methyltransferase [Blakeslea trispora]|nr:S-adenosyl-L-methionine-dependent methyltransferase [Blakeslea trispora]
MSNVTNLKRIQFQPFLESIQGILQERFLKDADAVVRVLEVGCGPGDFALVLKDRLQHQVSITAIDPSDDIEAALKKSNGNDVCFERNDIFGFTSNEPFDLILFTKSLHHCNPVEKALKNAVSMLSPRGLLIAEELNVNRFTTQHVKWFFDRMDLLLASGCMKPVEETLANAGHVKKMLSRFLDTSLSTEQRWFRPSDDQHKNSELHRDDPEGIMAPSQLCLTVERELGKENIKYLNFALLYHFLSFAG